MIFLISLHISLLSCYPVYYIRFVKYYTKLVPKSQALSEKISVIHGFFVHKHTAYASRQNLKPVLSRLIYITPRFIIILSILLFLGVHCCLVVCFLRDFYSE
jgi:hypothetical protein